MIRTTFYADSQRVTIRSFLRNENLQDSGFRVIPKTSQLVCELPFVKTWIATNDFHEITTIQLCSKTTKSDATTMSKDSMRECCPFVHASVAHVEFHLYGCTGNHELDLRHDGRISRGTTPLSSIFVNAFASISRVSTQMNASMRRVSLYSLRHERYKLSCLFVGFGHAGDVKAACKSSQSVMEHSGIISLCASGSRSSMHFRCGFSSSSK